MYKADRMIFNTRLLDLTIFYPISTDRMIFCPYKVTIIYVGFSHPLGRLHFRIIEEQILSLIVYNNWRDKMVSLRNETKA